MLHRTLTHWYRAIRPPNNHVYPLIHQGKCMHSVHDTGTLIRGYMCIIIACTCIETTQTLTLSKSINRFCYHSYQTQHVILTHTKDQQQWNQPMQSHNPSEPLYTIQLHPMTYHDTAYNLLRLWNTLDTSPIHESICDLARTSHQTLFHLDQ